MCLYFERFPEEKLIWVKFPAIKKVEKITGKNIDFK